MDYYISNINEGNLDYGDLAMLTRMFGSNMNSPMKRAANLAYIAKGVETMPSSKMGELTEYEHIIHLLTLKYLRWLSLMLMMVN